MSGTTLAAEKTAGGYWEYYPDILQNHIGVQGQVCVTNGGERSTQGLRIVDCLQYKLGGEKYQALACQELDVSAMPVLGPGDSYCYPYRIQFEPIEGASYRNAASVTIENHSGWLPGGPHCPGLEPCPFGPEPKVGFSLPAEPEIMGGATATPTQTDTPDLEATCTPTTTLTHTTTPTATDPPADSSSAVAASPEPRNPTPTATPGIPKPGRG
jgi:hypothetical protein